MHSRQQYAHVTHTQDLTALIEGLEDAWEFFDSVPARVIIANHWPLPAAVDDEGQGHVVADTKKKRQ